MNRNPYTRVDTKSLPRECQNCGSKYLHYRIHGTFELIRVHGELRLPASCQTRLPVEIACLQCHSEANWPNVKRAARKHRTS